MALVPKVNSTSHVPNIQDWITYYEGKKQSAVALVEEQPGNTIVKTPCAKELVKVITTENLITNTPKDQNEMGDVELVSPVQGVVQQARAEYARAEPIKRRTGLKRGRKKKRRTRGKQHSKKRKKRKKSKVKKKPKKKKGRRLKRQVGKKKQSKKGKRKYTKKRDIFTQ
jgi:hypothetical protein